MDLELKDMLKDYKIAVVHDWMFQKRGGERVLDEILHCLPHCDLFYLFGRPHTILKNAPKIKNYYPSFLSRIPKIERIYKFLLPLFPMAIESFDFSSYDLIISSSSSVAKGIIPPPSACHMAYVHTPMRYTWDLEYIYFPKKSYLNPLNFLRRLFLHYLRIWDHTSNRYDVLMTNSSFIQKRCELYWNKPSFIVHPPVDVGRFQKVEKKPTQKLLLFGAWVPYKRLLEGLEILIEEGFEVIAAGHGEDLEKAKSLWAHKGIPLYRGFWHYRPRSFSVSHLCGSPL
jgi:hypothetical protein